MRNYRKIQIHAEGKIDIHQRALKFEQRLVHLQNDPTIPPENKQLMLKFVRDCSLGKTILKGSRKKIGPARCEKYLRLLATISRWLGKCFDEVTQDDMDLLIEKLDGNQLLSWRGASLSAASRTDYKVCIKKFWKWKDGDNRTYPKLVEWIDTSETMKDVPALKKTEVESMIHYCSNPRDRALMMVLFDSGARIEELLNVRLKPEHISWKPELRVYKIRLEFSKTKPRTISLPLSTELLSRWLAVHPAKDNPLAQLFPMRYGAARMAVCRFGRDILKKRVTPHMLRHSSATYYANKLSRYQLCYRYGWTMSSDVVDRYLDREGIPEESVNEAVKESEISTVQKREIAVSQDMALMKEANIDLATELVGLKKELNRLKASREGEGRIGGLGQV